MTPKRKNKDEAQMKGKYIAIYSRQSHYKDGSVSHDTQQDLCKKKAESMQFDTNNVKVYQEAKNKSGATLDRPVLKSLIKDIKAGKISMVLSYRFDRLSRSLIQFAELINLFEEYDVRFITAQDNIDTTNAFGQMLVKLLVLFAEYERDSTIQRVKDAYVNKCKRGFFMGGRRPYGFNFTNILIDGKSTKKLVPNKQEMSQVKELFNTYKIEGFSLRTVLKHMLDKEMFDLSGKGWSTAKISNILRNTIYVKADKKVYDYLEKQDVNFVDGVNADNFTGEKAVQVYKIKELGKQLGTDSDDLVVLANHEGIIDSETWLKCQKKLAENNQIGNSISNKISWLGGKVYCGECGHRMTTIKGKPDKNGVVTTYFNCIGRSEKRTCKGPGTTVYTKELEGVVAQAITDKLKQLKTEKRVISDENRAIVDDYTRQINELKKQEDKFLNLMLNGDFNDYAIKKFNEKIAELGKNKEQLGQQIDDIMAKDDILTRSIDLAEKWRKSGFQTRKSVVNTLIDSIIIHQGGTPEIVWNI